MKKLALLLIALVAMQFSIAQNSEHMVFKGISIDGNINDFTVKLKQKGFTHLGTENGMALFKGEFAAYKDCTIGAVSSKSTNLVSKVAVIFPKQETWSMLYDNYNQLKSMLTQKYGEPAENIEKFEGYSEPRNDNSRMHEVKMDRCKYISVWTTDKGQIELTISHGDYLDCFVMLSYWDKINTEKVGASAIDDL